MQKIKLLAISGCWPHKKGNKRAAEVVTHQILSCLSEDPAFEIRYVCVEQDEISVSDAAQLGLADLTSKGVHFVMKQARVKSLKGSGQILSMARKAVFAEPEQVIVGAGEHLKIQEVLSGWKPDLALTVWSEAGTAAVAGLGVPVFAYYGNPDHKTAEARINFEWENLGHTARPHELAHYLKEKFRVQSIKRAHLKIMRSLRCVGDVASNDADFYKSEGVRDAFYVRNMWPGQVHADWQSRRDQVEQTNPFKMVGNVGYIAATGNTFGIHTIATQLVPELKRQGRVKDFEIHLFGMGEVRPVVRRVLGDESIKVRGFVQDLDAEILSSPVFLIANNYWRFKVGHTRFLHAWSLGACVVAFRDSAIAMPEIIHGENALLADSPGELASHIATAASDQNLRRKLGAAGLKTLLEKFDPKVPSGVINQKLKQMSTE